MTRPIPQPGERWRYYKLKDGKDYIANIIGIGKLSYTEYLRERKKFIIYGNWIEVINELGQHFSFVVKDTESSKYYEIIYHKDEGWLMWYLGLDLSEFNRKQAGWVIPLDNFMETLSSPYIGEFKSNYYRFEKVD